MHQQMFARSSDAWESYHLVLTASWCISTFQMADRKKRSPSRSASGSFLRKCVHLKCCSGSKPHDQRGHEEAHSPGCCLSLGNRGNSAQKHAGKAVVPQPEEGGRIQFSAHSCILREHKRRFSQTTPCKTRVACLHSVKEMPAWRKQSILILPIWSVFEPPGPWRAIWGAGAWALVGTVRAEPPEGITRTQLPQAQTKQAWQPWMLFPNRKRLPCGSAQIIDGEKEMAPSVLCWNVLYCPTTGTSPDSACKPRRWVSFSERQKERSHSIEHGKIIFGKEEHFNSIHI